MEHALLIVPVSLLTAIHFVLVGRRRGMFNVDGMFVVSGWVMTVGTLWLLDDPLNATPGYAAVTTVPYCLYVLSSIVFYLASRTRAGATAEAPASSVATVDIGRNVALLALFLLSVAITVAYFVQVGYNVFALGLQGLMSDQTQDYTTLRLNSYATTNYLFPGYVNQFKNIILPTLSLVWIHHVHANRRPERVLVTVLLAPMILLALLGTGQRGAFVTFVLAALFFAHRLNPRTFWRRAPQTFAIAFPPLLVATFLLGRSAAQLSGAQGILGKLMVLSQEIGKRFLYDNQWSGAMAYRYLQGEPTQWGAEWAQGLLGILPSNPGSSLARDVFEYLYKTDRGTAPVSNWGSVYYNFGWLGLLVVPFFLAALWNHVATAQAKVWTPNALEMAGGTGFGVVAGTWIAGGPDQLLNSGALTYLVLWWCGYLIRVRRSADHVRRERSLRRSRQTYPHETFISA